jgi:hypothetical protein
MKAFGGWKLATWPTISTTETRPTVMYAQRSIFPSETRSLLVRISGLAQILGTFRQAHLPSFLPLIIRHFIMSTEVKVTGNVSRIIFSNTAIQLPIIRRKLYSYRSTTMGVFCRRETRMDRTLQADSISCKESYTPVPSGNESTYLLLGHTASLCPAGIHCIIVCATVLFYLQQTFMPLISVLL